MNNPCSHTSWFVNSGISAFTKDGLPIDVIEFQYEQDDIVLSEWARHFRNQYCSDEDIDFLRGNRSKRDYLIEIKFPSISSRLGPSVRAGDFGEILIADYLQWVIGYYVPRFRWNAKIVRDESSKGCDVIGFHVVNDSVISNEDTLAIYEVKTKFSRGSNENRLEDAVKDSVKDEIRMDESLNYIKQRYLENRDYTSGKLIERFQSPVDYPYTEVFGAAAIYSNEYFDLCTITNLDCMNLPGVGNGEHHAHPKRDKLSLIVIKGLNMMDLAHELYRRAADES